MFDKNIIKIAEEIKTFAQKGTTISVAESCTGGMLSAYLTFLPGSSIYFAGGIIAYSNEMKIKLLGLSRNVIKTYGAVSENTAIEMAIGAKKKCKTDIAVSITGIAGPDGASEEKPVGTVCFGVASRKGQFSYTHNLVGSRHEIRTQSCVIALNLILMLLKECPLS